MGWRALSNRVYACSVQLRQALVRATVAIVDYDAILERRMAKILRYVDIER